MKLAKTCFCHISLNHLWQKCANPEFGTKFLKLALDGLLLITIFFID